MSGRHDRSAGVDRSAKLLRTGPIVILGLGRGMKESLLPGRPSRHRAFGEDGVEGIGVDEAHARIEAIAEREPEAAAPDDATDEPGSDPGPVVAVVPAGGRGAPGAPPVASRPAPRPRRRVRGVRDRIGRGGIGIVVLIVLALACAALIAAVVLKTRNDAARAAAEAAASTPPPLATPEPAATGPVVAVIGDGTTTQAAAGVTAGQRWTGVLETALHGTVTTQASAGMGYAATSAAGDTFVTAATEVPADADVVVFFGGAADEGVAPLSLAKAATRAYSTARQQAPDAEIVVIGPAITGGVDTATLDSVRSTLRSSAAIADATWVDPIGGRWLPASAQDSDLATALTGANEQTLATRMQAAIEQALD